MEAARNYDLEVEAALASWDLALDDDPMPSADDPEDDEPEGYMLNHGLDEAEDRWQGEVVRSLRDSIYDFLSFASPADLMKVVAEQV